MLIQVSPHRWPLMIKQCLSEGILASTFQIWVNMSLRPTNDIPWKICICLNEMYMSKIYLIAPSRFPTLTHCCCLTHTCVSKLTIIGSDNDVSLGRHPAIIKTNVGILLMRTVGTNFSEISSETHISSLKKMHLKMSSAKCHFVSASMCYTYMFPYIAPHCHSLL